MQKQNCIPPCIFSNWISSILVALLLVFLIGCEGVFEEDITDRQVELIAPGDNVVSDNYTQLFKWEEVDDALNYQLQIVRPHFDSIQEFVLDSTIQGTSYNFTLFPGRFQWRVRARNGSSQTAYVTRSIRIDSTLNLNGVTPTLRSPSDNLVTNEASPTFRWDAVFNSTGYTFRIVTGSNFESGDRHEPDQIVTATEHTLINNLTEGTYTWGVQAENDFSKSPFATRTLIIDLTAPSVPVLTAPTNNQQFASGTNLLFTWQASTENTTDSIILASDVNLNQVVWKVASDSARYSTDVNSGTYYWSVTRRDQAGNGSLATPRSFIVQ